MRAFAEIKLKDSNSFRLLLKDIFSKIKTYQYKFSSFVHLN